MSFPPGTPGPDEPGQPSDFQPSAYQPTQPAPQPGMWDPTQPVPSVAPMPGGPPAVGGPAAVAPSGEPVLVSIGDITVTPTRVYTPSGSRPLGEVQWSVTDLTVSSQEIPTWAIVCAVVFFLLCFLGLLFLLVKETVTRGSVQVSVSGPGFAHTTQIPVSGLAQVADINARVNYARTLAGAVPAPGIEQPPPGPGLPGPGQPWPQAGQGI